MKKKERKRIHWMELWEDIQTPFIICSVGIEVVLFALGIVLGISLNPWLFFLCAPGILTAIVYAIVKIFINYYY